MRLNGWLRLWIAGAVVALAACAIAVAVNWPSEDSVPHSIAFYDALSPEARAQIAESEVGAREGVRMPNGHVIYLKPEVAASRKTEALSQYQAAVLERVREKQKEFALRIAAWWLAVSLVILALGYLFDWVRAGFRPTTR